MKKDMKNNLLYPIVVAVVVSVILGVVNDFVVLPKRLELHIQYIERDMERLSRQFSSDMDRLSGQLSSRMDRLSCQLSSDNDSINDIKLFIASAHPERSILPLSSANKLQSLKPEERESLAARIGKYSSATDFSQGVSKDPRLGSLLVDRNISQNDLQNYWKMASRQKLNDGQEP